MSKVDRYYVDSDGEKSKEEQIVIRDRMSPMGELTYPTDIAVELTVGMYPNHKTCRTIADKICALLNEEL